MKRPLWLALLLLFLFSCGRGTPLPPPTPSPTPSATLPATSVIPTLVTRPLAPLPNLRQLRLFDRLHGWAITRNGIYRLEESGWLEVTPQSLPQADFGLASFFLDATHAWLLHSAGENGTLFITTDGRTWETVSVPFADAQLFFTSPSQGWALASLGAGAGSEAIAIYRSQDGGHNWELRFLNDPTRENARADIPLGGIKYGLSARDDQTAWVGGTIYAPQTPYLYFTRDGGASWKLQNLPLPTAESNAELAFLPPIFLSPSQALLQVNVVAQNTQTALYLSPDGGETWHLLPTLLDGLGQLQALSPTEWVFWNGQTFTRTRDAGQGWESITPNIAFGDIFNGMAFLTLDEGYLWATPTEDTTLLYHTLDGGRTWTEVH